ncbi:hypothetical protein BH10ACI1_BH10ACI1_34780 [soil metagenome]
MQINGENLFQNIFLKREDAVRCQNSLLKLRRDLKEEIIITGSQASSIHLLENKLQTKINLNDIDIVVKDLSVFLPQLTNDFLIRHFHPTREKGKILIMLVDAENKLKICCFTPQTVNVLNRLSDFEFDGLHCKLVSVEDILAKLLGVIYPITRNEAVEEKYYEHFKSLLKIANWDVAKKVWRECRKAQQTLEFEEVFQIIKQKINANPKLLQSFQYSQNINEKCQWCIKSELFPIAPLSEIHKILGYV